MTLLRKLSSVIVLLFIIQSYSLQAQRFYQDLQEYCDHLSKETSTIPANRKDSLKNIGNYLLQLQNKNKSAQILFVGKTNGGLSQVAEIWFYTALHFYKVKNIQPYSGGIHPEAINYRIVGALKRCGLLIMPAGAYSDNPVYFLNLGRSYPDYTVFAKPIDYHTNPHNHYLIISILAEVDSINYGHYGAEKNISYHWKNPSLWDDTAVENSKYDECVHEMGRDLFYLAGYLHHQIRLEKTKKRKR